MIEEWREIPGHPDYLASNYGRIAHIRKFNTSTKQHYYATNVAGYSGKKGTRGRAPAKRISVHRLVALAFIGPRPHGAIVRHLDDNPLNNHVDNLAYGGKKENANDARTNGRLAVGHRVGSAKISEDAARDIIARYKDVGRRVLAAEYGLSVEQVSGIGNGRYWKHLHGVGG